MRRPPVGLAGHLYITGIMLSIPGLLHGGTDLAMI